MPNSIRFRMDSEITADIKARLESLGLFAQVARFHGSNFERIRAAIDNTVLPPGAIVQAGYGDWQEDGVGNARQANFIIYMFTGDMVLTEDNESAALSDIANAVAEAYLPQAGTRATKYTSNGVKYLPSRWSAVDFAAAYDVYQITLSAWDARVLRTSAGVPV